MAAIAPQRPPQRPRRASRGPSEKVFAGQVVEYARLLGWAAYHTWLSVRSEPGFPDLVLLRGPRLVVVELKRHDGVTTPAQDWWLARWREVPGAEVFVWRPTDADWRTIETTLR